MTAEEIKKDIEDYNYFKAISDRYTEELQQLRSNARGIVIDSVCYYLGDSNKKQTLTFYPSKTLSVQVLIDCLEQHIKNTEREMSYIREKYKGMIDFED